MRAGVAGIPVARARARAVLRSIQADPGQISPGFEPLEVPGNLPYLHAGRVKDRVGHETHLSAGSLYWKGLKVGF
jgi:hypothetical protein